MKKILITLLIVLFAMSLAGNCSKKEEDNTLLIAGLLWYAMQDKPEARINKNPLFKEYHVTMWGFTGAGTFSNDAEFRSYYSNYYNKQIQAMEEFDACDATIAQIQTDYIDVLDGGKLPPNLNYPTDYTLSQWVPLSDAPKVEGQASLLNARWSTASLEKLKMLSKKSAVMSRAYSWTTSLAAAATKESEYADHTACGAALYNNFDGDYFDYLATKDAESAAIAPTKDTDGILILNGLTNPVKWFIECAYGKDFTAVNTPGTRQKCATFADEF